MYILNNYNTNTSLSAHVSHMQGYAGLCVFVCVLTCIGACMCVSKL